MVVKWLKHDWTSRCTHAPKLLEKVRLGLLPVDTLKTLLGDEILAVPECRRLVEEVVKLQSSGQSSTRLALDFPHIFATRSTMTVSCNALLTLIQGSSHMIGRVIPKRSHFIPELNINDAFSILIWLECA